MENEQLPAPPQPPSSSAGGTGTTPSSTGTGRPPAPQISVYSGIPDRQTVQVIQQALHRQPNTAAQYLQQMYAAQQQHLMLQTAALQQQHLTSAQLQSLAAVQQASLAANRQSGSSGANGTQAAPAQQPTINLATSPAAAQLLNRAQSVAPGASGIAQQAVLLGNAASPALTASQAQMYLRAQMVRGALPHGAGGAGVHPMGLGSVRLHGVLSPCRGCPDPDRHPDPTGCPSPSPRGAQTPGGTHRPVVGCLAPRGCPLPWARGVRPHGMPAPYRVFPTALGVPRAHRVPLIQGAQTPRAPTVIPHASATPRGCFGGTPTCRVPPPRTGDVHPLFSPPQLIFTPTGPVSAVRPESPAPRGPPPGLTGALAPAEPGADRVHAQPDASAPGMTSGNGSSASTVAGAAPHNGENKPPQAIVKPQILTHVIEGFVIQEGAEPFPVGRSSLLVGNLKKKYAQELLAEKLPQQDNTTTTDSEMEEPYMQESKEEGNPPKLKCELCGRVDFAYKFKRSKRFCSMACAKRYNVGCTKRVGLFHPDRSKLQKPGGPPHGRRRTCKVPTLSKDTKKQTPVSLPTGSVPLSVTASLQLNHSQEDSSRCSDNSSYEEPLSPISASSSTSRRRQGDRDLELRDMELPDMHMRDLAGIGHRFLPSEPSKWNVEDVYEFIRSLPGCQEIAEEFRAQEIDGQALLLLKEDHLMSTMNIKLGPALKIYARISMLKDS
uniref:Polyhomeotic homolog 2 n=1 Tax=Anser brachyrhynchus TaxID=132585 RepID=A0A8B9BNL1_9AVES